MRLGYLLGGHPYAKAGNVIWSVNDVDLPEYKTGLEPGITDLKTLPERKKFYCYTRRVYDFAGIFRDCVPKC